MKDASLRMRSVNHGGHGERRGNVMLHSIFGSSLGDLRYGHICFRFSNVIVQVGDERSANSP